ncbi:MAG: glycoside hydrolase family 65 protein [Blautia sp.]|nr:glycoside hydrolase family 65 protein [Lachnoclostridium sp.]MCM1210749.1 glycoside hydrolase family 65 protein [Blautia sp.]
MNDWLITRQGFNKEEIATNGNRFFCGNGYMGIRGTLEEYEKEFLPAINLGGIYDKVGDGWREPLNAPNPLFMKVFVNGEELALPKREAKSHVQQVDYRHGLVRRETKFQTKQGQVTITTERFAHMKKRHMIFMQLFVMADFPTEITVRTGIDGAVWDINGPHYDELLPKAEEGMLTMEAITHESRDRVAVAEYLKKDKEVTQTYAELPDKCLRELTFFLEPNQPAVLEKAAAIFTSKDGKEPLELAKEVLRDERKTGYSYLKKEQVECWEKLWEICEVEIEGDEEAEEALNYSLYHLLSIAPFHAECLSIPARGLSGQTYKGAVFWDTEMFMLDFFLNCQPSVAKTLLRYRIDTLPGAQKKAAQYGYQGAFYAWESQEGGFDACSDYNVTDVFTGRPMRTYFKDKQIHISAAIVYGIVKYLERTGDKELLYTGGARVILECARFYDSLLVSKAHTQQYELRDVIGPDEYHERINNNGYTNRMAKFVFEEACQILTDGEKDEKLLQKAEEYRDKEWKERFRDDAEKLYIPKPAQDGIVEQFDGYRRLEDITVDEVRSRLLNEKEYWGGAYGVASDTQIIKQADVVTWMVMFPEDFTKEQKWNNWKYYEPRTEHGSSLSACMYSILACTCDHPEEAYPFFRKSAEADIKGGGKEWAGNIYIGGTHPAAAGGAYMTAVFGFGGLCMKDGKLTVQPRLPETWKTLKFKVIYQGEIYEVTATKEGADIHRIV